MEVQDDKLLLTRLHNGDNSAFRDIYLKYHKYLLAQAYYSLKDPDAAQDLVHDLFLKLWQSGNLKKLGGKKEASLKLYLKSAVKYMSIDSYAKTKKKEEFLLSLAEEQHLPQDTEPYIDPEVDARIKQLIKELPPMPKQTVSLVYFQNLKNQKIAEQLGISPATINVHLHRGILALRKKLKGFS